MNIPSLSILFLLTYSSFGASAVQTDWSGGSGIQGPVPVWDDTFDSGVPVNWYSSAGSLELEYFPSFTLISQTLNGPASIECFDLEGDGDSDLLVCGSNEPGAIVIFENQENGSVWATRLVDDEMILARCARSGDFNGDSLLDVIALITPLGSGYTDYLVIYIGQQDGTWQKFTISEDNSGDQDLCPVDVDSDGDLDFLCTIPGSAWFGWLENLDGSGTSWESHNLFTFPPYSVWSLEPVDYDYDGDIDVLLVPSYSSKIYLLENHGDGSFTKHSINDVPLNNPTCASSGDIDGDGDLDVVGSAKYGTNFYWFEQTAPMEWAKHAFLPDRNWDYCRRGIGCADFDSDGDQDVFATLLIDGSAYWYENLDGSGGSWKRHYVDWCAGGSGSASGDFNCDGRIDIATTAEWSNLVRWIDVTGYPDDGMLESSILHLGCDPQWDSISWTGVEPEGTSIAFQLRSSDDVENLGAWSDTINAPSSITGILDEGDSYLQYKVIFETTQCRETPVLEDLMVSWDAVSVSNDSKLIPTQSSQLTISSNPSELPSIEFTVLEASFVRLDVFDMSGRLVLCIDEHYSPGHYSIAVNDFTSGVFFCRLFMEGYFETLSFVVIE